jgi:uncharacterized membrane protein
VAADATGEDAARESPRRASPTGVVDPRRSFWSGAFVGVGIAGFVDETVFHQLLHWHHFYDRSTPTAGLVSDGLFHAASWFCVVGGLFLLADLRRRGTLTSRRWTSGMLIGLGAFQLYDGTIQHKLMRLHQIRYHVTIWPYDVAWDAIAVAALVVGVMLYRRTTTHESPAP